MIIEVSTVHNGDYIIQLVLKPSNELLAVQQRVVDRVREQLPFKELHITLCSCVQMSELPAPPSSVELTSTVERVSREDKTSCYLRVTDKAQRELEAYVDNLQALSGQANLKTPGRVFHVSLTNLAGTPRASIAKVWDHPSSPVFL